MRPSRMSSLSVLVILCLALALPAVAQMNTGEDMKGYAEVLGVVLNQRHYAYDVTMIQSSAPGNILYPGEQPTFTFQVINNDDAPIDAAGKVEAIAYGTRGIPGDIWLPDMYRIADVQSIPVRVQAAGKGFANVTVSPKLPPRNGAYALVMDLGPLGRRFATTCVRTFAADPRRIQYPKMSLDHLPHDVLRRLGVQAIRMGWSYTPTDEKDYDRRMAELDEQLKDLQANQITVLLMIGTGHRAQPLGRGRPHLDANGVMLGGKEDLAWLPAKDGDFEQWVFTVASKYGWPKGPITAFSLWNEPWEGLSISGWGADMVRYRTLFTHMARGVERARAEAGVEVLIGGCDSSTNTWDKLFSDGSMDLLKWLDVCTIHYQGMSAPSTHPEWVNRKHKYGRVKIWDTESWTANTDDRLAAVVATNRACGYDRSMGVFGGNIATDRRDNEWMFGQDGKRVRHQPVHAWSVAASVGAVQHFIGEREFREVLFKKGLPWVYLFDGLGGSADDGTVVVVGDIGEAFGAANVLFRTVRGLAEVAAKEALRTRLAALPADSPDRAPIQAELAKYHVLRGAKMTIPAAGGKFSLYDFYGNPVPADRGRIVVPLNHQGFFLRPDGSKGSFAALVEAVRAARIEGYEPLEIIAHDLLAPIDRKPALRLTLTNVLNRPLAGKLSVSLGDLKVEAPAALSFGPHETKDIEAKVAGGQAAADNTYALAAAFDAGADGRAVHHESMHCNVVARRSIVVDGKLDDWKGVLPQTVRGEGAGPSLTEAAWFPFAKYDTTVRQGFATGYLAYDDEGFYFAAKVADDTPHPGTVRFETRNDDAYFYPEVSRELDRDECMLREEVAWNAERRKPHALLEPGSKTARSTTAWTSSAGAFAIDMDLPADRLTQVALYFLDWDTSEQGRRSQEVRILDRKTAQRLDSRRVGRFGFGTYAVYELSGQVRLRFQTGSWLGPALSGVFFDKAAGTPKPRKDNQATAKFLRLDEKTEGNWPGAYGGEGYHVFGTPAKRPGYVKIDVPEKLDYTEYRWPEGVRRFSYRTWPDLPAGNFRPQFDNVQIAFNAIPIGQDGRLPNPPGTMPRFTGYKCTDYEYALNPVAARYGGGTETWRMLVPGMPRKHFYPRQPASPLDGPVKGGKLAVRHEGNTRIVECAIPWSELPDVRKRLDAGRTVKFSFRVNDDGVNACMELARERSVSQRNSQAFHVDWAEHWANELEFAFEGAGSGPAAAAGDEKGFVSLFNGKDLTGWKSSEDPRTFAVVDGAIVAKGPRAHLYYVGEVGGGDFRNFEFRAEVLTRPKANSGLYFHTRWQPNDWPSWGYEAQVNNTHGDWRRTGSLYAVQDVRKAPARDNEWFDYHILVRGKRIVIQINGQTTVDYTEPAGKAKADGSAGRYLSHGTFAIQGHDPGSEVHFRNLRVRPLSD